MAPSELFGTFSEPGTLAAGDKYIDKAGALRACAGTLGVTGTTRVDRVR